MKDESLLAETLRLLGETRHSRRYIAEMSGLDYNWLNKLAQGAIHDPGIRKIQRLNACLKHPGDAAA